MKDPRLEAAVAMYAELIFGPAYKIVEAETRASFLVDAKRILDAIDAVDPLRPPVGDNGIYLSGKTTITNREPPTIGTHKQFGELPRLTRVLTADGLIGVVNQGGITALMDDLTCEWHALEDLTLPLSVIHVPTPDVSE